MIVAEIFVILVLLVANGLFAMSEMAMVSSRKSRLRVLADKGAAGAATALRLVESPNRFLPTVQLGITLVGLLAGAFGGATIATQIAAALKTIPGLAPWADAIGLSVVVIGLTFFSLVLGELVPKRLALADPERIACRLAIPMDVISRLARPLVRTLGAATDFVLRILRAPPQPAEAVSEDEVKVLLQEGMRAGVFHEAEPGMVEAVLALDRRRVTDIMTPRGKVIYLRLEDPPQAIWHKIVVSGHSSFPVYEGTRDNIVGVVSVKSIYANLAAGVPAKVSDLMLPPLFVPATHSVTSLLESFKRTGKHLAVVRDARDKCLGLVTLVDVLEAIVGEIPSLEERLRPNAVQRADGSWLVDGAYDWRKLRQLLQGSPAAADGCSERGSVAACARSRLGGKPREGDGFSWEGWRLEVLDMDGDRIDKVLVTAGEERKFPAGPGTLPARQPSTA